MTLAFHASPPAGHWLNDPNGLAYLDGAYRLFAQHRADAPKFRATGWARFSSPDLLRWTFDGSVIASEQSEWAYSGCVEPTLDGVQAIYTAHVDGLERQVWRSSGDHGRSWGGAMELPQLGPPARNHRDPYSFRDADGWGLLLANPCDWTDWAVQPPSTLQLFRSDDGREWREAGRIGPWRPTGVMWEVPLLVRLNGHDVLLVSEIDRRHGGADCSVRAWIGNLQADGFLRHPGVPAEGQLVDHGPDFYAVMASAARDWPGSECAFVAWLSNWETARAKRWPGFYGGPISLPRTLSVEGSQSHPRLTNRPLPNLERRFQRRTDSVPASGRGSLTYQGDNLLISVVGNADWARFEFDWLRMALVIERGGRLPWQKEMTFIPASSREREIVIFIDGPVVELFLIEEGVSISLALDWSEIPFKVTVASPDHCPQFCWTEFV